MKIDKKKDDIMKDIKEYCPVCSKEMKLTEIENNIVFRGVEIVYNDQAFVCSDCNIEVSTIEQTGETQIAISDSYRKAVGLLTGKEILENRRKLGLSQKALADKMTIGIDTVKRWEGGIIQSKFMDKALRNVLWDKEIENDSENGSLGFLVDEAVKQKNMVALREL